ncbi:MAG: hypothetical protein CMH50_05890 [Myxococcales bacterium]|nr:hypothetical protein [Myxococcales bacterium]
MPKPKERDDEERTAIEAAVFRRLVQHLQNRTDVQNIDLMILANFCRNCLGKWYLAEAQQRGVEISDPEARKVIYGMPYSDWKKRFQKPASPEQMEAFNKRHQVGIGDASSH